MTSFPLPPHAPLSPLPSPPLPSLLDHEHALRTRLTALYTAAEASGSPTRLAAIRRATGLQGHQLRRFIRGSHLSIKSLDRLAQAFDLHFTLAHNSVPRGRHSS